MENSMENTMDSDTESVRTEASVEVEDFSPPPSPEDSSHDEVEDFSPPESPGGNSEGENGMDQRVGGAGPPLPYQFEPLASGSAMEEEDGAVGGEALPADWRMTDWRMGDKDWCTCGNCEILSPRENVCCREVAKVMNRCAQVGGVQCMTVHPGFEAVTLNPFVLQAVYGTYLHHHGEMEDPVLNNCYRHLGYRNFVRWCWGYLGDKVRVVLPSCVVTRIRQECPKSPDSQYRGFLPPLGFQ